MIKAAVTSSAVPLFLRFWTSLSLSCSSGASLTTKAGQIKFPLLIQGTFQGGFNFMEFPHWKVHWKPAPQFCWGTASDWVLIA